MKIEPNKLRQHILDMVYQKSSGHIGGSFSLCELVAYLYNEYDPINTDKLILSKGHAVPVIYAALHELGYISEKEMKTFREVDSRLQGHPDKRRLPLVHATTGSLGQGLSIAVGHALAMKMRNDPGKVFCIIGDGEIQEGQIWEALMFAPKYKLDNLICFLDYNKLQSDDHIHKILNIESIEQKIKAFNWNMIRINGHSIHQISTVFDKIKKRVPTFVIMDTVKGYGVDFMEDNKDWHSKVPGPEEFLNAKKQLGYE